MLSGITMTYIVPLKKGGGYRVTRYCQARGVRARTMLSDGVVHAVVTARR